MHYVSLPILITICAILVGCAPSRLEKPTIYLMDITVADIPYTPSKTKPRARRLSDQRINICFAGDNTSLGCLKNVKEGHLLQIETDSRTLFLQSIELLGDKPRKFAFGPNDVPKITISGNPDFVYAGRLLIEVDDLNDPDDGIGLFSGCVEKSVAKIKQELPNKQMITKCFDLGAVWKNDGMPPVTLMLSMPPLKD